MLSFGEQRSMWFTLRKHILTAGGKLFNTHHLSPSPVLSFNESFWKVIPSYFSWLIYSLKHSLSISQVIWGWTVGIQQYPDPNPCPRKAYSQCKRQILKKKKKITHKKSKFTHCNKCFVAKITVKKAYDKELKMVSCSKKMLTKS